jgi:hypothetical protein
MRPTAVGLAVLAALAFLPGCLADWGCQTQAGCWNDWGCQTSDDCASAEVCRDHVCYPPPTPPGYGAGDPSDAGDGRAD